MMTAYLVPSQSSRLKALNFIPKIKSVKAELRSGKASQSDPPSHRQDHRCSPLPRLPPPFSRTMQKEARLTTLSHRTFCSFTETEEDPIYVVPNRPVFGCTKTRDSDPLRHRASSPQSGGPLYHFQTSGLSHRMGTPPPPPRRCAVGTVKHVERLYRPPHTSTFHINDKGARYQTQRHRDLSMIQRCVFLETA